MANQYIKPGAICVTSTGDDATFSAAIQTAVTALLPSPIGDWGTAADFYRSVSIGPVALSDDGTNTTRSVLITYPILVPAS